MSEHAGSKRKAAPGVLSADERRQLRAELCKIVLGDLTPSLAELRRSGSAPDEVCDLYILARPFCDRCWPLHAHTEPADCSCWRVSFVGFVSLVCLLSLCVSLTVCGERSSTIGAAIELMQERGVSAVLVRKNPTTVEERLPLESQPRDSPDWFVGFLDTLDVAHFVAEQYSIHRRTHADQPHVYNTEELEHAFQVSFFF